MAVLSVLMQSQPPGNPEKIGFERIFPPELFQILKDYQNGFACQIMGIVAVTRQPATIPYECLVTGSVQLHEHLRFG
jgi:hypothetical protein